MGSLKLFIKAVRKAKTIADERTVVRKESAAIRTAFRDPNLDQTSRRVNISKLLYLHILGEKTHFGQVECLKLLASPRFADKRLGYLAAMLVLDENQEVLTLLTNSLDNDMQHHNSFIVGLALTCLGNVASPELARDLHANVDRILALLASLFLRKKACVVAARLVEKDPDLAEIFLPRIPALLADKAPLLVLGAASLTEAIYTHSPASRDQLLKSVPRWLAHLKRLVLTGYMPDYDVGGVTDPFVQASLLAVLRMLVADTSVQAHVDDTIDVLTQIALNLDPGKNAAHAVLYECVKTIFAVRADQALRVLGVNLLGKFLLTKDNNTRYVALEMLFTVVDHEPLAVQRHRATIVSCLGDADVSIRRRALELTFAIINDQNVRVLAREVLAFLETCPDEDLKPFVVAQLSSAAARYAPTEKWHFDTLTRMLLLAGARITQDIVSHILALVLRCSDPALKKHVVAKLVHSCTLDPNQYALAVVAVWCVGEYADLVVDQHIETLDSPAPITAESIVQLFHSLLNSTAFADTQADQVAQHILTACVKLSVRLRSPPAIEALRRIITARTNDTNLEIQVRAVEYAQIFGQDDALKQGVLAHMPAPALKERTTISLQGSAKKPSAQGSAQNSITATATDDLLDLLGSDPAPAPAKASEDLLSDIFGSMSVNNPAPAAPAAPAHGAANGAAHGETIFSNGEIKIDFVSQKFGDGQAVVDAEISSQTMAPVDHVQLLIAVPKTQKLTIVSTSGSDSLVQSAVIKQTLKIAGKAGAKVKLRVKVKYNVGGVTKEDLFDYGKFEQTL